MTYDFSHYTTEEVLVSVECLRGRIEGAWAWYEACDVRDADEWRRALEAVRDYMTQLETLRAQHNI